jgi:hypothetical protein
LFGAIEADAVMQASKQASKQASSAVQKAADNQKP